MACSEFPQSFSLLYPYYSVYLRGCHVILVSFSPCFLPCSWKLVASGPHGVCTFVSSAHTFIYTPSWCWYVFDLGFLDWAMKSKRRRIKWRFCMIEPLSHVDIWLSHEYWATAPYLQLFSFLFKMCLACLVTRSQFLLKFPSLPSFLPSSVNTWLSCLMPSVLPVQLPSSL